MIKIEIYERTHESIL